MNHSSEYYTILDLASELEEDEFVSMLSALGISSKPACKLSSTEAYRIPSLLLTDPFVQLALLQAMDEGCEGEFLRMMFNPNLLQWAQLQQILPFHEGELTIGLCDWAITKR